LVTHAHASIEVLVLDHLVVLLTEEALLELHRLCIGALELTDLEVKGVYGGFELVTVSYDDVKLSISLIDVNIAVLNCFIEPPDPILQVSLFLLKDLNSQPLLIAVLLPCPELVLGIKLCLLLSLADLMAMVGLMVELLDFSSKLVVVCSHILQVAIGMDNVSALLLKLSLHSLDLLIYVDAFITSVMDGLLHRVKIALEISDDFGLVPQSVLVVSLAVLSLTLETPDSAIQVQDDLLEYLEVALTGLMILDLLTV